jgi:hypothetical protein
MLELPREYHDTENTVMSNEDHTIDRDLEKRLRQQ